MKKLTINFKWSDLMAFLASIGGLLAYFVGMAIAIAMSELDLTQPHRGAALVGLLMFGLGVSMLMPAAIVKLAAKDADEEEVEEEEHVDCETLDSCPQTEPRECVSFGTDACPLEAERGDV